MITADAPDAFGHTIFCDDIRVEVGGKITYVGSYGSRMAVHGSFPFSMPKLALAIFYSQRFSNVVLPIKFWIFLPGDAEDKPAVIAEMPDDYVKAQIAEGAEFAQKHGPQMAFATVHTQFGFAPFIVSQPGFLKVRALRGDRLIRLGSLDIVPAQEQTPPTVPAQT
jgi:hypothetical protein